MRITLITDAWFPQINGVVTTWSHVREELQAQGHTFEVIHPDLFRTFAAPRYPEIRLAILPNRGVARMLDQQQPDAIHIATEGPLGMAGRKWCQKHARRYTTSYHTKFPEYLQRYFEIPIQPTYAFLRWFHRPAERTLVPTESMRQELIAHGFDAEQIVTWTRGVNHAVWHPYDGDPYPDLPRPIFVYCGRVAPEKNIEAFLSLKLPGSMVVVGDGPARAALEDRYRHVRFVGFKKGEQLARHVAGGDVFVFPSLTDTFGVVMIEAMAAGLPVAAYPVTGPVDVVRHGEVGYLSDNLHDAAIQCLDIDRRKCLDYAADFTWKRCAQMVLDNLAVAHEARPA